MTEALHKLTIIDPEGGSEYNLLLNNEDYLRADRDQHFLSSLLFHAKTSHKPEASNINEESKEPSYNNNIDDQNLKSNYAWKYNQVVELIKSMSSHMDDLNHPRKRKEVFEPVANDLISMHFEVNSTMVQNKWNSLLKSYRKAKDNQNRTGRGPSRFNFFEMMDEVLGSNPANSCSHSISSSNPITPEPSESLRSTSNTPDVPEDDCENDMKQTPKQKLKRTYLDFKHEECVKKQKRHEDRLALEREKIKIESRKLDLLERYLQRNDS